MLSPFLVGLLWLFGGPRYAYSGAIGLAMTLVNLWLAARIIGVVAEHNPQLLLAAAMGAFVVGLALLTAVAFALQAADVVHFPVTGLVLIGSHLGLVLWEAPAAYDRIEGRPARPPRRNRARAKELT